MTAFDDAEIPLINGTVRGLRAFNVNDDGTLTSLIVGSENTRYAEGINHATCLAEPLTIGPATRRMLENAGWYEHHDAPFKLCMCGFYAYFNETHENGETNFVYSSYRRVVGIVEGSGRCIVGDEGFRAEKIKIVALVDDTTRDPSIKRSPAQFIKDAARSWSARFTNRQFMLKVVVPVVVLQIILSWVSIATGMDVLSDISFFISMALICSAIFSVLGTYAEFDDIYSSTLGLTRRTSPPPKSISEKIRAQYPNVAHYRTLDEARADFPLSNRITP